MSCSSRKHRAKGRVQAWELYDGVVFRLVKKLQREGRFPEDVDILILSARYGLIRPTEEIEFYDQRMTSKIACKKAESNGLLLRCILNTGNYREVFIVAGRVYLSALKPFESWLPEDIKLVIADGGIGQKLRQTKNWLEVGTP